MKQNSNEHKEIEDPGEVKEEEDTQTKETESSPRAGEHYYTEIGEQSKPAENNARKDEPKNTRVDEPTNLGVDEPTWETHSEWWYAGHGEWVEPISMVSTEEHGNPLNREPIWIQQWLQKQDKDIQLHNLVLQEGYPNRWGAKKPVESQWNLTLLQSLLEGYHDQEVVEWLKYGWPIGRLPTLEDPQVTTKNHKGATDYPEALQKYIEKEHKHNAIMGPYNNIPFEGRIGISPLRTRAKKTSTDRRVILDLSFPIGNAVNDGIPKDSYLGFQMKLTFPRVDDFALRIFQLGEGCCMFKIDLSRYFRQIPLDPGDYSLIGYVIQGKIYFDKVLPMGMRSAPYIEQRLTNAITHIHTRLGFFLLNYVDDFVGAEEKHTIWEAYNKLTLLLQDLRVATAPEKIVPPHNKTRVPGSNI